jgi:uncharacterized protein (DUF1778 family)
MGRKPAENPKDVRINTRHTSEEKDAWQSAADAQGLTLAEFIRKAVWHYIGSSKKRKK